MAEGGAGDRIRCSVCTALGPKQADCEWFWDADTLKACCISVVVGEGTGKIIAELYLLVSVVVCLEHVPSAAVPACMPRTRAECSGACLYA